MEGPPLGPGGEDITWPDQVAPRGRKASSTRKIKPQTSNLWILVKIGDQVFRAVLDTGATLSIVARRLLKTFKKTKTVAIRVGDGRTIHSLGGVDVTICLGNETVTQHCRVLDTDAFDIVSGTDFLRRNPQVKMRSLQRPYSLHCDFGSGLFSVPLELSGRKEAGLRYASKTNYRTENYQLARHVLENGLAALQVNLDEIQVELFASQQQHIMQLYCSKKKSLSECLFFFSIDPQHFGDGSTSSPGYSVIGENPGLFKFWSLSRSCYGFEQQQRSSAQIASRSRNRADSL